MKREGIRIELRNEFAHVTLTVDQTANGPRLCITDRIQERKIYLDPLRVECLTRMCLDILDNYLPY